MRREDIPFKMRMKVYKRDNHTCRYCGSTNGPLVLDHVYPFSKGGETTEDNLVTCCEKCNKKKARKVGIWPEPVYKKENIPLLIGFVFFVLGIGVITTPLSPNFPQPMAIFTFFLGGLFFVICGFYLIRAIKS